MAEYVERVKQQVEAARQEWLDPHVFATYLAEPLLRWSVVDPTWSDGAIGLLLDTMKRNNSRPPATVPTKEERLSAAIRVTTKQRR